MAEYSRDVFSKYSKEQLLDYIEQQTDQLGRFETRFRDVVRAYKGVLKEKEALEATIQALSISQTTAQDTEVTQPLLGGGSESHTDNETDSEAAVKGEAGDPVRSDLSEGGDASDSGAEGTQRSTPMRDSLSPSTGNTGSQLRRQLSTLTAAMATLTEEKAKMESSFQKDKKTMLTQHDSLSQLLQTERESSKKENIKLQQQIEEVRESLRSEQRSRQDEQETNAQMLRELQTLIATERDHKEALTIELEELNEELCNVREQVSKEKVQEYQELIQSMSVELEQVKGQLAVTERHLDPSPQILKLKQEMAATKEENGRCLRREQEKLVEAEERLRLQAQHEEQRVAGLEAKLSSLSETIGGYDRLRENDQATIQKLKERVAQLDSENTVLTKEHIDREDSTAAETTAQVTALQEKVAKLKALIKLATVKINEMAVLPANVEELSVSDYADILSSQPSGKEYQQELSQLKEEFERYKTRAQSVLRNRGGGKDLDGVIRELQDLQRANHQLQIELDSLREQAEEEGERHSLQLQKMRQEMRDMDSKHRREVADANTQYKNKLQELQTHIQTTRSRTLKLMDEKDTEIQKLRTEVQTCGGRGSLYPGGESPMTTRKHPGLASQGSTSSVQSNGSVSEDTSEGKAALNLSIRSADSSSTLQELLDKSSPMSSLTGAGGERRLLHVVQEQKARDNDLAVARRKRLELEDTNRDLVEREQRHFEQIALLKGEIRKLERDRSRETESMEYLKNIIMHYMCADSAGRDQMISPIATVLHFSPEEVSEVKRKIAARRWLSAPPK